MLALQNDRKPCELDQTDAEPKENFYRVARNKLISKLYMDQSAEVKLDHGGEKVWGLEEDVEKKDVCHPLYEPYTANILQ